MGNNDALLEPLKGYNSIYKESFRKNANDYFDELLKKSGVNVAMNKDTVNKYKEKVKKIGAVEKLISKKKGLKGFLIFLMIVVMIAAIALFVLAIQKIVDWLLGSLIPIVSIGLFVLFLMIVIKKINPKIKSFSELKAKLEKEANDLLSTAWAQMAPLNALYDWGIAGELITKTIPLIEWDKYFDVKKYQYLHDKFGLSHNDDKSVSTYYCTSGSVLGNPFLICKDYRQTWYNKQYEGHITISWTERVKTENGYRTVTRTETLYATVTKPAPSYNYETYLIYGNEAAPDLKFYRNPSGVSGKTEKEIDKVVKKKSKALDKKAEKAIINNTGYTKLGNDEFEVLFGATNRNNEVQFRLLFTPLAQNNLLDIIKNPEPYGDDFYFEKDQKLNYIQSKHSQAFDYYDNPAKFVNYDCEAAKKVFVEYMCEYFKNFYFDIAPLMSVPLYQQTKTREYIYNKEFDFNISPYEHEAIANSFNTNYLKPDNADTPSILKSTFTGKVGNADNINIDAYAFDAQKRVTYVSKLGGDGRFHNIPVYWFEYVPVEKKTNMMVENKDSSRKEFNYLSNNKEFASLISRLSDNNACLYERGLFAILLNSAISEKDLNAVNSVYQNSSSASKAMTNEEIMKEIQKEVNEIKAVDSSNIEDIEKLVNKLNDNNIASKEVEATEDDLVDEEKKLNINENENKDEIDDDDESNE